MPTGSRWYRAHRENRGPWYFSSSGGRFDLPAPEGTCYLASTVPTAAREVVGPDFAASGRVPASLVRDRVVSALTLPMPVAAARLTSSDTLGYGVIGSELSAAVGDGLSGQWARAFFAAGYTGIWYSPRFSGADSRALALFGATVEAADWDTDPSPTPLAAVIGAMADLNVMPIPQTLDELDVLDTPVDG